MITTTIQDQSFDQLLSLRKKSKRYYARKRESDRLTNFLYFSELGRIEEEISSIIRPYKTRTF